MVMEHVAHATEAEVVISRGMPLAAIAAAVAMTAAGRRMADSTAPSGPVKRGLLLLGWFLATAIVVRRVAAAGVSPLDLVSSFTHAGQ
jgi:hypothetical protein